MFISQLHAGYAEHAPATKKLRIGSVPVRPFILIFFFTFSSLWKRDLGSVSFY